MELLTMPVCRKRVHFSATLHEDFAIRLVETIDEVESDWSMVSDSHDIFYSAAFLRSVERAAPSGIKPYYCVVTHKNVPIGIIYLQSKAVRLEENLKFQPHSKYSFTGFLKKWVTSRIHFHTIICGNLMLTGRYGFYFPGAMEKDEQFRLVAEACRQLRAYLTPSGIGPGLVLIKDFFSNEAPLAEDKAFGFTRFSVQPKMILHIRPEWNTLEDYISSLKSKYRVRFKKAKKKLADIRKRTLSAEEISFHRDEIHRLYRHVADQAEFNAFYLNPKYFETLKEALGDAMTFTTYWKEGKLVAFFTSIVNYEVLDAHFLGYDPSENQECQIYLNMLYDLIQEGIEKKLEIVDMSRTAIEIKSTVGAVPHDMYLYLRHDHALLNKATNAILSFVKPKNDFTIRNPFREAGDE
ncbi:MAG: GNAT family N-acetyltransferase [Saprospiraceae bacterium]|nr:GNAT family N-acetyltransferase [Saprospiraceae bacterium]